MPEKNVLIITYYWPPSGGSGVQRWLKFVKYLPSFGYTPYVFTPENPSFDLKDESLMKDVPAEAEVIHFPIWEPYKLFYRASNSFKGGGNNSVPLGLSRDRSLFQRIAVWIRGNFLIPDPRVFWVRPSVKFLEGFIKDKGIRTIITTGPPHSVHLIGLKLKKRNAHLRWVADFRDPWSTWGFLDSLNVGSVARSIHRSLEKKVLTRADRVVTITPFYERKFESLSGRKVELITNGFDEDDFANLIVTRTDKFVIRHVGIVNEKCDPRPFVLAIKKLITDDKEFAAQVVVDFLGEVHPDFRQFVAADAMLRGLISFTPPVPHNALVKFYGTSSLLVLILSGYKDAEGYMPGKLFEYIATGLPILGVGPSSGDAAGLMKMAHAGKMIDSDNEKLLVQTLQQEFHQWKTSTKEIENKSHAAFSRRGATEKLASLLDELTPDYRSKR